MFNCLFPRVVVGSGSWRLLLGFRVKLVTGLNTAGVRVIDVQGTILGKSEYELLVSVLQGLHHAFRVSQLVEQSFDVELGGELVKTLI